MKRASVMLGALVVLFGGVGPARADFVTFSIAGNSADWPFLGRTFQSGTITGVLEGLVDNQNGQTPTGIEFTSDVSALGIASNVFYTPDSTLGGIDIANGQVLSSTSFLFNFTDLNLDSRQLTLNYSDGVNYSGDNVLIWNGGNGSLLGMGNAEGFGGVTFSALESSVNATPEPSSLALLGTGVATFAGYFGWRRGQRRLPA